MAKTTKARPAQKPARASALGRDDEGVDEAAARKLAGVDKRKITIASTMVYAGVGARASEREKTAATTAAVTKPARRVSKPKPVAEQPDDAVAPAVAEMPRPVRRRLRSHAQFIVRLLDTINAQLDQIDAITRDPERREAGPGEAERHARTVAALARVAAELRKEQDADRRRRADDEHRDRDPDRVGGSDRPRDLDELRERLSRRLDIRLGRGPAASMGDDAAGRDRVSE